MDVNPVVPEPISSRDPEPGQVDPGRVLEQDLLVEDVSIDGMCGVY